MFCRYKVDGSSWSKQLPTIVLFENGKEKMRRPYVDYKGTVQKFFFSEVSPKVRYPPLCWEFVFFYPYCATISLILILDAECSKSSIVSESKNNYRVKFSVISCYFIPALCSFQSESMLCWVSERSLSWAHMWTILGKINRPLVGNLEFSKLFSSILEKHQGPLRSEWVI